MKWLDTLSEEEHKHLCKCVEENSRTLYTTVNDAAAVSLCEKGLLYQGNLGSQMHYPFIIPDQVWNQLKKHQEKYFSDDGHRCNL